MPNWCANRLTVSGPQADLDSFRAKARCPPDCGSHDKATPYGLCANAFVPMPAELNDPYYDTHDQLPEVRARLLAQYGATEGYGWQHANWGVKWGFCAETSDQTNEDPCATRIEPEDDGESLTYTYETPWGPAEPLLVAMSRQHPALTFTNEYAEPMMDFSGSIVLRAGETLSETTGDASANEELAAEAPFFR